MVNKKKYSLYCDESCHLQYDRAEIMCIGGIVVPDDKVGEYKVAIKNIKRKYGVFHEIKWNTISATHINMYKDLIDFFFASDISFCSILIKNKGNISAHTLDRDIYNSFYYSIVEKLIRFSVYHNGGVNSEFRVFLDLKDSHGVRKLQAVANGLMDEFGNDKTISLLQNIRSHESVFIQLADVLIGAIGYRARGLASSSAKLSLISYLEDLAGYALDEGTDPGEEKFSICDFQPKRRNV